MDGYTDRVSDSSSNGAACRELVFICADSGAVVTIDHTTGRRPALVRAVAFLASGETVWADGAGGGSRATFTVEDRGSSGQYDLRLSVQGALLPGPADLAGGEAVAGRRVPVGLELTLEPASARLVIGPGQANSGGHVTMVRGTGLLAVGSVIRRLLGTGWSAGGADGGPGAAAGCRARAVFQDSSGLYVAGEAAAATAGHGPAGAAASGTEPGGTATDAAPVAALVRNTQIRAAAVREVAVGGTERGLPGRTVSWAANGRSPAAATGKIRDPQQRVTVTTLDPSGAGRLSWSCAPFVFVRSGVTGLGVVELRAVPGAPGTAAEPVDELPDPF